MVVNADNGLIINTNNSNNQKIQLTVNGAIKLGAVVNAPAQTSPYISVKTKGSVVIRIQLFQNIREETNRSQISVKRCVMIKIQHSLHNVVLQQPTTLLLKHSGLLMISVNEDLDMQALNQLSQHLEDRLAGLVNLFHQEVQPVLQPEKDVEMV